MSQQIQLRRGTTAQWAAANPTLAVGEIGIDTTLNKFKIGNGSTAWSSLTFVDGLVPAGGTTGQILGKVDGTDYNVGWKTLAGSDMLDIKAVLNDQTGTTYTLASTDNTKMVTCTNGSAITVTLPNNLPVGFQCAVVQGGAGQITFSAASGATIRNRLSQSKAAGQYAAVSLFVIANSGGSSAIYLLAGDTAA